MTSFNELLKKKFVESEGNNYGIENYDEFRFGKYPPRKDQSFKTGIKNVVKKIIGYNGQERLLKKYEVHFQHLYEILEPTSRELLVDVIALRLLGFSKVKMKINDARYWEVVDISNALISNSQAEEFSGLKKIDLKQLGYDLRMYFKGIGFMYTFGLEQYAYKQNGTHLVSVETGDVVFDMGACWGDTALYFAQKQSPSDAQVYSFEFTPGNIEIFSKNVSLNPQFERNIKLVPHPVSDKSGVKIYFTDNGQGSRIEFEKFEGYTHETTTMAIDDFVRENNIQKVDFLKMDIEGSELPALLGAIETIKKFKPKLAIAIYHSWDDFVGIPKFIKDLNLGYELHLGHYTIHTDETIIFAKIKK